MPLKLKTDNLVGFKKDFISSLYKSKISEILQNLQSRKLEGIEMTGWIEWVNLDHEKLIEEAEALRLAWMNKGVETVAIIGTGGSYIGCRAGLEFVNSTFASKSFEFIFVPYFSERYLHELCEYLSHKKFAILVISKSGTTLESAVAFRLLRELLHKNEGDEYLEYICAITDRSSGVLRGLVDKRGIRSFVIENDIGGRYSTLTAVGLVPMVLGGVEVRRVLEGAKKAHRDNFGNFFSDDSAALYASLRHYLYTEKKLVTECFACYDPHLNFCLEKAKQLFSESEGKRGKGIMPVVLNFTPDLHSVGQLLQEGNKSFFETTLWVKEAKYDFRVQPSSFENDDNLDWIAGKSLKEINECAFSGTVEAHSRSGYVNNIVIELDSWDPFNFGYFYYWLSMAAMYSSYLFEVNPFNQPGVEIYKKRMFELLGKPS